MTYTSILYIKQQWIQKDNSENFTIYIENFDIYIER